LRTNTRFNMHIGYHEIIAAIGGFLFILVGIARQMERARMLKLRKPAESAWVWISLLVIGMLLLSFAFGIVIYRLDHH
jgi:hypothetical protein